MTDCSCPTESSQLVADGNVGAYSGSFERDTVTWAFAKLAERTLDHLFSEPSSRARYARWLREEAPLLTTSAGPEQGLYLTDLKLGDDGHFSLVARPTQGEFILVAQHRGFHVVMASYYEALTACAAQECVCIAHFEGDPRLAARWASGLREWLVRQWQDHGAIASATPN